jgi:hypothetical protein
LLADAVVGSAATTYHVQANKQNSQTITKTVTPLAADVDWYAVLDVILQIVGSSAFVKNVPLPPTGPNALQ